MTTIQEIKSMTDEEVASLNKTLDQKHQSKVLHDFPGKGLVQGGDLFISHAFDLLDCGHDCPFIGVSL